MKIYIDSEYKCHVLKDSTRREFEASFFDGKCDAFIEGYRYVPEGETWTRADGEIFNGEMISPWKDYNELYRAQAEYEHDLLIELQANAVSIADAESAYQEGVNSI